MIRTGEDIQVVQQSYGQALKRATARIVVCAGPGCVASGSPLVYQALLEELQKRNLYTTVDCLMEEERDGSGMLVTNSGCQGFCQQGPLVRVEPEGVLYTR